MNDITKNVLLWVIVVIVLFSVFNNLGSKRPSTEIAYSDFYAKVEEGQVKKVLMRGRVIHGELSSGVPFITYNPESTNEVLMGELLKRRIDVKGEIPEQQSLFMQIFISWFPLIVIIGIWIYLLRQMQGGGGRGAMSFGKSKARMLNEDQVKTRFSDVAGVDEAKEEVFELVEFLREPAKFQKLGGMIPRGVLMVGSPGTGKTLLAKAIAGEAKVPFFTISGSDFVEMFVGVGASRVRDMFEQAKKHAPCIIFIDEIDAVGRHRGAGLGGGHDEREQTLNQLLVEMDGFEGNDGVIVIAATNRPDVLDPALLRPGRFDRQVVVPLPDIRGREQILKVHLKKVPIGDDVKASIIARGTPGFSGADLANLINEAALFAAKENNRLVTMANMEKAKDKIMMGAERRSMVMSEKEKTNTAYHEAGHAILGRILPDHDPVYKVTIIPRGKALGVTMFLPEEDRYSYSRAYVNSNICTLFGGRIAEGLIFGEDAVTTGASNDIQRATELARNMVTKWGFSEKLGPIMYSEDEGEVFLGQQITQHKNVSNQTADTIDDEVRIIIDKNYEQATTLLTKNIDILHAMSAALMKYETLNAKQLDDLMARKTVRVPDDWNDDNNDGSDSDSDSDNDKSDTELKSKEDVKPTNNVGDPAGQH